MTFLEVGDEWFKVCYCGKIGYVNANYIRILAVYTRQLYYADEPLRGDDVLFVQVQLFQKNYEPGALNGVYTEQTQKAVRGSSTITSWTWTAWWGWIPGGSCNKPGI
jgi:hypothetical protein